MMSYFIIKWKVKTQILVSFLEFLICIFIILQISILLNEIKIDEFSAFNSNASFLGIYQDEKKLLNKTIL